MKRNTSKQAELFAHKTYQARKVVRALAPRSWHHLVMKSGKPVLRIHATLIKKCLRDAQLRYGIELKSIAIMENHLHLCVRIPNRTLFANFLRVFAGQTALKIKRGKLWSERAWTRILTPGRDLQNTLRYIEANPVRVSIFDELDVIQIQRGIITVPLRP